MDLRRKRPALWSSLAASDTGRAAGMAAATIAANVVALIITVVFARLLGASGYGSLAALMSAFIILMVPGSALQIAVAREVSREAGGPGAGAGIKRWLTRLALATLAVAVIVVPLRGLIAGAIGVDEEWAAAAVPVTAMLWTLVSVMRGALQGFGLYRTVALSIVGEGIGRLVLGLALVGAGLDVTGAFLGTPLSMVVVAAALVPWLKPHLPPDTGASVARLRDLLAGARAPVAGLTLLFVLQEVHVIVVKHEASGDAAGSYAVAAVAAKAIIWVAVGLGLYLLPEVSRRAAAGGDGRPVLTRTLGLIAALGVPMVIVYAVAGEPLLRIVFGEDLTEASGALPLLGLAMGLLACTYLSVQYLLGLHHAAFIWLLALAAMVEVTVLVWIPTDLERIALALLALQAVCAVALIAFSFRAGPGEAEKLVGPEAGESGVPPREVSVEHAHSA